MEVLHTLKKGEWDSTADNMVQQFKETGHLVFKSISALSRGILKQKKGKSTVHFQWRFDEHRTLVPNDSFGKSAQYVRSRGEWKSSVRLDRGRKGMSQFLRGQQDVDKFTTGRSTTLGISSDSNTWKQDARKRFELRSTDQ